MVPRMAIATRQRMKFPLTPASQRAVDFAAGWTLNADCSECSELTAPAALVGAAVGVGMPRIDDASTLWDRCRQRAARWPALAQTTPPHRNGSAPVQFSDEVRLSLRLAQQRLINLPQPLELATEHILLGLAINGLESAVWLRQQGIDPAALDVEIHSLYGQAGRPLEPQREGCAGRSAEIRGGERRRERGQYGRPNRRSGENRRGRKSVRRAPRAWPTQPKLPCCACSMPPRIGHRRGCALSKITRVSCSTTAI